MKQKTEKNIDNAKQLLEWGYRIDDIPYILNSQKKDRLQRVLQHHHQLIELGLTPEEIKQALKFVRSIDFLLETLVKINHFGFSKQIPLTHYTSLYSQKKVYALLEFCENIISNIKKYPEIILEEEKLRQKKRRITRFEYLKGDRDPIFHSNPSAKIFSDLNTEQLQQFWYFMDKYGQNYSDKSFIAIHLILKIINNYHFADFSSFLSYFEDKITMMKPQLKNIADFLNDLIQLDCLKEKLFFDHAAKIIKKRIDKGLETYRLLPYFFTPSLLPHDDSQKTYLINLFLNFSKPEYFAKVYAILVPYLNIQNLLDFMTILSTKNPSIISDLILILHKIEYLFSLAHQNQTLKILTMLIQTPYLNQITTLYLNFLPVFKAEPRCITLDFFEQFVSFSSLLTQDPQNRGLIGHIPMDACTLANYLALTHIASTLKANPIQMQIQLRLYITRRMIHDMDILREPETQSTHLASVHASSSETALKLLERYAKRLTSFNPYEISSLLHRDTKASELKKTAALSVFQRLVENGEGNYCDPVSKINLRQLLFLSYLAIKDHELHASAESDTTAAFIEGLYEIERGYNLNEAGIDDLQKARPICASGSFNKLIEKLQGIHPDACIRVLKHEAATAKFPIIVRNEVHDWIRHKGAAGIQFYTVLKNSENPEYENYFAHIWSEIAEVVKSKMLDEYGPIYLGPQAGKLEILLSNYQSIDLGPCLQKLEDEMSPSTRANLGFFNQQPSDSNKTQTNFQTKA